MEADSAQQKSVQTNICPETNQNSGLNCVQLIRGHSLRADDPGVGALMASLIGSEGVKGFPCWAVCATSMICFSGFKPI